MLKINYFPYSHCLNYLLYDNQIIELFPDIFESYYPAPEITAWAYADRGHFTQPYWQLQPIRTQAIP